VWGKSATRTSTTEAGVACPYADDGTVLRRLKEAFEKGRYSYEINDERSPNDIRRVGEDWNGRAPARRRPTSPTIRRSGTA
jgi:hypothetical protein